LVVDWCDVVDTETDVLLQHCRGACHAPTYVDPLDQSFGAAWGYRTCCSSSKSPNNLLSLTRATVVCLSALSMATLALAWGRIAPSVGAALIYMVRCSCQVSRVLTCNRVFPDCAAERTRLHTFGPLFTNTPTHLPCLDRPSRISTAWRCMGWTLGLVRKR
jgi:hypothetical protein